MPCTHLMRRALPNPRLEPAVAAGVVLCKPTVMSEKLCASKPQTDTITKTGITVGKGHATCRSHTQIHQSIQYMYQYRGHVPPGYLCNMQICTWCFVHKQIAHLEVVDKNYSLNACHQRPGYFKAFVRRVNLRRPRVL